ncbi:hypothetical protein Q3O59_08110 [Alkalimonas delamerensis]|uniref:Glycosyl transferase family 2 n=1 Tax=Alkalimonas delamerensis TaxID=265981 RepID=A0ABT9GPW6_9GAMM|nr:hypothetical protein [Alkalimonas delamerensis]MDP4528991.1 hypothetical protein [Alkalimonas delamerensis]
MKEISFKEANRLLKNKSYQQAAEAYLKLYDYHTNEVLKGQVVFCLYLLASFFEKESENFKLNYFKSATAGEKLGVPTASVELDVIPAETSSKRLLSALLWGSELVLHNSKGIRPNHTFYEQELASRQLLLKSIKLLNKQTKRHDPYHEILTSLLKHTDDIKLSGYSWVLYCRSPEIEELTNWLNALIELDDSLSQQLELVLVVSEPRPDIAALIKKLGIERIQLHTCQDASMAEAWDHGALYARHEYLIFSTLDVHFKISPLKLLQQNLNSSNNTLVYGDQDPALASPLFVATAEQNWLNLGGFKQARLHEVLELVLVNQATQKLKLTVLSEDQVTIKRSFKHPKSDELSYVGIKQRAEQAFDLTLESNTEQVSIADWHFYLGIAREMQLKWETAAQAYQDAIKQGRQDAEAYFRLFRVLHEQGDMQAAAAARLKATQIVAQTFNGIHASKEAFNQDQFLLADYALDLEKKKA